MDKDVAAWVELVTGTGVEVVPAVEVWVVLDAEVVSVWDTLVVFAVPVESWWFLMWRCVLS